MKPFPGYLSGKIRAKHTTLSFHMSYGRCRRLAFGLVLGAVFWAFSDRSGSIPFLSIYSPLCFANDTKVCCSNLLL